MERPLRAHPRVALRRRVLRGMWLVVVPVTATLALLGALLTPVLLHAAWIFLVCAVPVAWWLGVDAYRQGYRIPDLAESDAPALAETAAPHIIGEFLVAS